MGLRFSGDTKSPAERFARLRETLGDKFMSVEIDSSPGNPWGYKKSAHSVLDRGLLGRTHFAHSPRARRRARFPRLETRRRTRHARVPKASDMTASIWGMTPRAVGPLRV